MHEINSKLTLSKIMELKESMYAYKCLLNTNVYQLVDALNSVYRNYRETREPKYDEIVEACVDTVKRSPMVSEKDRVMEVLQKYNNRNFLDSNNIDLDEANRVILAVIIHPIELLDHIQHYVIASEESNNGGKDNE